MYSQNWGDRGICRFRRHLNAVSRARESRFRDRMNPRRRPAFGWRCGGSPAWVWDIFLFHSHHRKRNPTHGENRYEDYQITCRYRHYRSILQFRYDHQLSMAEIARAVRVSKGTVHNILSRALGAGLDRWPLPEGLDDAALRRALCPPDPVPEPDDRLEPDWSDAVKELTRKRKPREPKPALLVLWERYCDAAREAGMPAYSYSRYCERLAPQLPGPRSQASMRFTYAPGECLFTDFAGRTLRLADGVAVETLVGILAWSRYTYAEAVPSQKAEHWCMFQSC